MKPLLILLVLALGSQPVHPGVQAVGLDEYRTKGVGPADPSLPDGLSTSDWSSIRAAYDAERYRIIATDDGYRSWNPGQRWTTHFDGHGFEVRPDGGAWTWGLELQAYGWGAEVAAVNEPLATETDGGRLAYDWDERLTEWYKNDTRGVEHGYTLRARPDGAPTRLALELEIRGDLEAVISPDGEDLLFEEARGGTVLRYTGLSVFDSDGHTLPARWQPTEADGLRLLVDDDRASYPITIDPIAQQAYLKASNTDALDNFGWSVSVSDDTVVVGATLEDSNATGVNGDQSDNSASDAGAAYVFVRSGTSWSQQAYLKASNTNALDNFGWSVSVSGDTVVVGALEEDSNATGVNGNESDNSASDAGAAYVFVRSGTSWSQQAYLKASNSDAGDRFGRSVSVSGDTVVVGADDERSNATGVNGNERDNNAVAAGAAYVFVQSGSSWSQQAYVKASNTEAFDEFGFSVSVSGDTVLVGAREERSNATGVNGNQSDNDARFAGAAYVFEIPIGPVPYCTPKASSAGCLAVIGTTSATQPVSGASDYQITATNVHSVKVGLLFASLNGAAAIPWLGGTLCVAPPLAKRGPLVASGGSGQDNCTGAFATLVNDGLLPPDGLDAGPGNTMHYQYWYRDPANGPGTLGTALSDAIQLDFQ